MASLDTKFTCVSSSITDYYRKFDKVDIVNRTDEQNMLLDIELRTVPYFQFQAVW
jgi:hypothetical protein